MKSQSVPTKGVHTDTDITKHNQSYARESINGRFTKDGIIGTWETVDLFNEEFYQYEKNLIGEIVFEGDTYLFLHNEQQETNNAEIWKYSSIDGSSTLLWQRSNDVLNWDKDYPITGFLQRSQDGNKVIAYLTDKNNPPLAFDILDAATQSAPISDLYITQKKGFVQLTLNSVKPTGNLIPAVYYYAIKAYKDSGISTDWFMMLGKVTIPKKIPTNSSPQEFQNVIGGAFNEKSNAAVELKIEDFSTLSGWKIKVAAFMALDEITIDVGKVFYDGNVSQFIIHSSNIAYEEVSIDEVGFNTLSIIKCGEYVSNGDIAVIGNIEIDTMQNGYFFDNLKFKNALGDFETKAKIEISLKTSREFDEQRGLSLDLASDDKIKWFSNSGQTKEAYFTSGPNPYIIPTNKRNRYKLASGQISFSLISHNTGFADHSNPIFEHYFPIYRRGESRRLSLVPFDLYGKPTRPIYLGDLNADSSGNSIGSTLMSKWNYGGDGAHTEIDKNDGHFYTRRVSQRMYLWADTNFIEIKNIILNDFVDYIDGICYPKISGFSIVECDPPAKRIVAEGFATRVQEYIQNRGIILAGNINLQTSYSRNCMPNGWLIVYSPQLMNSTDTIEVGMKIVATTKIPPVQAIRTIKEREPSVLSYLGKFYERTRDDSYEGIIEEVHELPYHPDQDSITIQGIGTFKNTTYPQTTLYSASAIHIGPRKTFLIKLQSGSNFYSEIDNNFSFASSFFYEIRIENNVHGFPGQTDADLVASTYKYTNHFQKVSAQWFQNIRSNNDFITDIFTYGGKFKAGIFQAPRYVPYHNETEQSIASHTIYMPVLTEFNLRLRAGNRHAKNRIVETKNTDGLGLWKGIGVHEENLLNNTYKNVRNTLEIYPIPLTFTILNKIVDTIFWTNKVTLQGGLDQLRIFYPNQYKMCDRRGGTITGLAFTNDRLYVFQENSIGFLPYEEKTMAPTVSGGQFTISYGDIFPKYERMSSSKGLSNNQLMRSLDELIVYFSNKDSSINLVNPNGIKDVTVELGIKELCKEFKNSSKLRLISRNNIVSIAIQYLLNILDINLTYGICNGYQKIKQDFSPIAILNMGYELGINSEMDAPRPQTRIYIENKPNSSIKLYDTSSLVLVMGSESLEQKTFDNLIITSDRNKLPKTINFIIGNDDISEPIIGNQYALIDDNTINISTPLRVPLSTTKSMRLRDDSVMLVKLSSDDMFRIHDVICEIRKNL